MDEDKNQSNQTVDGAPATATPSPSLEAQPDEVKSAPNTENGGGSVAATPQTPLGDPAPNSAAGKPNEPSAIKRALRQFNLYLLLFVFLLVIAGSIAFITFQKSQEKPPKPNIASQNLSTKDLQDIANSNATVGNTGQTLTIQGDAIINGESLLRSNLAVAGSLKLGGDVSAVNLIASGSANLGPTQANSLQVAGITTINGATTLQNNLNVGGSASIGSALSAPSITTTKLTISGNGGLSVPNHISFPGTTPARTSIDHNALGGGGSATITGSDTAGTIQINTGNGPQPGCFVTVTFARPFASTPHVIMTPVGSGAGKVQYYVTRTTTQMQICSDNSAPGNQRFAFDYFVAG